MPEKEDGFSYRFFDASAALADILAANEIVSSNYHVVSVSVPQLVTVKDGELKAEDYFDEVALTVSLSDGTEVEIKLNNPAPIKAGETVTTGGVGSFAAAGEVPAGTQLVVNADPEVPKGIVFPGSAKKGETKRGEETKSETESDPIFFDISLIGPDGKEIQTGASVTISTNIKLPEAPKGKTAKITGVKVYHIGEKGDAEELKGAEYALGEGIISSVSFQTSGFSLFAVTYSAEFVAINLNGVINLNFTDFEPYPAEDAATAFVYDTKTCDIRVSVESVLNAALKAEAAGDGVVSSEGGVAFMEGALIITADGSIALSDGEKTLTVKIAGITRLSEEILRAEGVEIQVLEGKVPLGSEPQYTAHTDRETDELVKTYKLGEGEENIAGFSAADLKIIRNDEEVSAEGQFKVTLKKANLIPEGMKLDKLYHIHENENGMVTIEPLNVEETEAGLVFEVSGFSDIVASYTVDFESAEGVAWSWPGQGTYTLNSIMDILGITAPVTYAELVLVSGTREENELYLTLENGEYVLHSDVAFRSVYELRIIADKLYVITVRDSSSTADLKELLDHIDIQNNNNETVIENGSQIIIDIEKTYEFIFSFKEKPELQYDLPGPLYYDIPDGVDLNLVGPVEFETHIGSRVISGNTYSVVEVDNGNGGTKKQIQVQYNMNHLNSAFLEASQDVQLDLRFSGRITKEFVNNTLDFSAGTSGYSVINRQETNASVRKEGSYDASRKKMVYTVYVTATQGSPENVNVVDTITGAALTFDAINYVQDTSNGQSVTYQNNGAQNGLNITIPRIEQGCTIKIEYTANVDFTKIAANNNATVQETGNGVVISSPSDNQPDDNVSYHDEKNINFSSIIRLYAEGWKRRRCKLAVHHHHGRRAVSRADPGGQSARGRLYHCREYARRWRQPVQQERRNG